MPPEPLQNLNSATSTLIGPGNAASPFPATSPAVPGPIPDPNITTVIAAGNATGLFPEITPAPGSTAPAGRGASQAGRIADAVIRAPGTPVRTAQVLGLIALALAFLLAMTRLSRRGRTKRQAPGA